MAVLESKLMGQEWSVFSSYDLEDRKDGASQHLADFFSNIPEFYNKKLIAMKSTSKNNSIIKNFINSNSTFYSLILSFYYLFFGINVIGNSGGLFLLGSHTIPFSILNKNIIYVALDCWSEREKKISLSKDIYSLNFYLRIFYFYFVYILELLYIKNVSLILVVSQEEMDKYICKYPFLKGKIFIIPPKPFALTKSSLDEIDIPKVPSLLIWMDCRTSYGMESVGEAVKYLQHFDISRKFRRVVVLSRTSDAKIKLVLGSEIENCVFVEDFDEFVKDFEIVILPDKTGSGIKNRTIKAAIEGKFILCRPEALEGFDLLDRSNVAALYETKEQFVEELDKIILEKNLHKRENAFRFFSRYLDNSEEYNDLWQNISLNIDRSKVYERR